MKNSKYTNVEANEIYFGKILRGKHTPNITHDTNTYKSSAHKYKRDEENSRCEGEKEERNPGKQRFVYGHKKHC